MIVQQAVKQMTMPQAIELCRRLYYKLGDSQSYVRAPSIRALADEHRAHIIIVEYMTRPMMTDEAVCQFVKDQLGLED